MIEAVGLTKRYGDTTAVDDITFTVEPGQVTGFLGPNGAGKSTTMRLILGLDRPTSGTVTVDSKPYQAHRDPLRRVGALLEARSVHPARTARDHLLALARTHAIPRSRVDEVLELVGLQDVARKRAGNFSLGMGQRLGIAAALLGDPATVVLDEPVNGLDPDGVIWIRELLRTLGNEGRTVLVSSHLMAEMALVASRLLIIGRGKLLADTTVTDFIAGAAGGTVRVRSPQAGVLAEQLRTMAAASEGAGIGPIEPDGRGGLQLQTSGIPIETIGAIAARDGIVLHELADHRPTLEQAYLSLTGDHLDYHGTSRQQTPRTQRALP